MRNWTPVDPVEFITNYTWRKDAMNITLKNVRLSFPQLFRAEAFQGDPDGKKQYRATFLIPKNDPQIAEIKAAILDVATAAWKDKAKAILASIETNPNKNCFLDGNTKTYDGYENQMALTAVNVKRPPIKDRDKSPLTEEDGRPYAGCYVNALVEFWAQDNTYGKAIRASLRGVQFVRDGDSFTAGSVAQDDDFEDLSEGADAMADLA